MIRYLKYIFLIFGTLAFAVMAFFSFQNRKDIGLAWDYWDRLDYDTISKNCETKGQYYYPCFKREFQSYLEKSGLTGVSIGLKLAFNFMDEDKASTTLFETNEVRDFHYALDYLELNNMAISQSYLRFYGFKNLYGGYLSSLRDFLDGAKKFSDNLVKGLEGENGVLSVKDEQARSLLLDRFEKVSREYELAYGEARNFVDTEIEQFLAKAEQQK